ncbi:hypothetical protein D8S78_11795 [Natrialba swarupiae]|nr:hypothetical protein [Natrialba swarupiae]
MLERTGVPRVGDRSITTQSYRPRPSHIDHDPVVSTTAQSHRPRISRIGHDPASSIASGSRPSRNAAAAD